MNREYVLRKLGAVVNAGSHIIGSVSGSGMTAKYATIGGADFLLALSAGKIRNMGRGSFASYFCYGNSNEIVMEMGTSDLIPLLKDQPILFGLFASDPTINVYDYLHKIKAAGFSGVVNFPTVALVDGKFREAIEEDGNTFESEVEAIRLARSLDMFTIAFVTDEDQTIQMLDAGADVICVHLGFTKGGILGPREYISLESARKTTEKLFAICEERRADVFRMIYAGPATTAVDTQYLYGNTSCQGYIGGSTFDRLPTEKAIVDAVRAFRSLDENDPLQKIITGQVRSADIVPFIQAYISNHYDAKVKLGDLALLLHVSQSYLSTKFGREVGCSFTDYLLRFRMNKAAELLKEGRLSCKEVAERVGYEDYAQFSKMFKSQKGKQPSEYGKSAQ